MRRAVMALPALSAVMLQGGCYRYVPMYSGAPTPGERYTFEISDQGRVGLADRLGPGVTKVEGTLVGQADDAYVVSVAGIESISGGTAHWSGEQVPVRQEYVRGVERREFSRGRTFTAIGAAAIAIGAFIATRGLIGSGSPPTSGGGGGTPSGS
jgi:hypothetical protein